MHSEDIIAEARKAAADATSLQKLVEARAAFLGRKGRVSTRLRELGALPEAERAAAGKEANALKEALESIFAERKSALARETQSRKLETQGVDVTQPGIAAPRGCLHPVSRVERDMCDFFKGLGYSVEEGPELESDWNNFGALNFPKDHPARDMQDTFFVEGEFAEGREQVLRTHTSPVQIRAMSKLEPPFRFIVPGRVYRYDLDPTHYPMFHQIEGFCVGERVSFGDLKGTLFAFARHLFGADARLRFRAHYFPFTEPSAEMDVSWGEEFMEWGGCGMIHPKVLENCNIDPARWQGFAFGMALDRAAMIRHRIPNIQLLFEGDVRVLEQL